MKTDSAMETSNPNLPCLYPNSYMQSRPNFRRGFGGQYTRQDYESSESSRPSSKSPQNPPPSNSHMMTNFYLHNVISIPFSYDLPLSIANPISVKWIEQTSRCNHIERRCTKLIQTALRKLNQGSVKHPELISIMFATCQVNGEGEDPLIIRHLKRILNVEDRVSEQDECSLMDNGKEGSDLHGNMDFMSAPTTIEHLRSASDPYTYKSLVNQVDMTPMHITMNRLNNGTSCESSCNTSSASSVDGSKSELNNNNDEERLNGHELNTILRRLHRCIVLRLANRKQILSGYHQEVNNLENTLKKIIHYMPDNFTPGNLIPRQNVATHAENQKTSSERNRPSTVLDRDDENLINQSALARLRTGQQVAKTTSIRFERLCNDISSVIRLLCQMAKRIAIFEGRKLVNSNDICLLVEVDANNTDPAYYDNEYISQQIDALQKRADEAISLKNELEMNRKRLLQSVPPWLTFKDKDTSQLPVELNGEVRQHLANYITSLFTTSLHFNVMKTLVTEDENFCQVINETLNDISFI